MKIEPTRSGERERERERKEREEREDGEEREEREEREREREKRETEVLPATTQASRDTPNSKRGAPSYDASIGHVRRAKMAGSIDRCGHVKAGAILEGNSSASLGKLLWPKPTLSAADYFVSGQGVRSTNTRSTGPQGPLCGSPRALARRDTLIEMHTDLKAVAARQPR